MIVSVYESAGQYGRHDRIEEPFLKLDDLRPWAKPAAYLSLASISCFLFTAYVPPLLDPALAARIPLIGSLQGEAAGYWMRFALSFLLLGLAPLVTALAFGDRPSALGLRFDAPILRSPLYWCALPVAVAVGAIGALSPDLGSYYPYSRDLVARTAAGGALPFLGHFAAYFFLYYLPWELFFRGFLVLGLARAIEPGAGRAVRPETGTTTGGTAAGGGAAAVAALVLFQTMPSTMLHVGHPMSELFSAVIAGLGFGYLAWKTKSIVPGLLLHAAIGLGTDGLIVLRGIGAF